MLPLISLCSVNMGRGLKFHRDCSPRQQDDVLVACFQLLPIAFKLQIRQKENNLCKQKGEKKGGGGGGMNILEPCLLNILLKPQKYIITVLKEETIFNMGSRALADSVFKMELYSI